MLRVLVQSKIKYIHSCCSGSESYWIWNI